MSTVNTNEPAPISDWVPVKFSGLIIFLAALVLFGSVLTPSLWTGGDDARNLLAVKSYLAGFGTRLVPDLQTPEYQNDRGYIIFLSFLYLFSKGSIIIIKTVFLFPAAGSVILLYLICRQHNLPPTPSIMSLLLFVTSPALFYYINILIPETTFLFFSLLFCFLGERYLRTSKYLSIALLAMLVTAIILRGLGSAAPIFFGAFALTIPWRGRTRALRFFLPLFIVALLVAGPAFMQAQVAFYTSNSFDAYQYSFTKVYNLFAYTCKYIPAQFWQPFQTLSFRDMPNRLFLAIGYFCGFLITVLAGIGLWHSFGKHRSIIFILNIVYLVALIEWPVIEGGRFLFFLLPYLIIGLVGGIFHICRRTGQKTAVLLCCLLAIGNFSMVIPVIWQARQGYVDPNYHSYDEAIRWLANRDNDSIIAARKPHPALWGHEMFLVTNYTSSELVQIHPEVKFIVADTFREWAKTELREYIEQSGVYTIIYRTSRPEVVIYERIPDS